MVKNGIKFIVNNDYIKKFNTYIYKKLKNNV